MNNNTFVHKYISTLISKNDVCVDMTAGNGNDTLFLAQRAAKVYAFDIAEEAIRNTTQKLQGYDNVVIIRDSHVNIDRYIDEDVRLFIFNLGYLPGSENPSVTIGETTLLAFRKAYEMLAEKGYIIITFYLGHAGGKSEYWLVSDYIRKSRLNLLETYDQGKPDSPITWIIYKDHSITGA